MDLSHWYKISPNVKIVDTRKKFYNKYVYKLVYHVVGASSIIMQAEPSTFFKYRVPSRHIGKPDPGFSNNEYQSFLELYKEKDSRLKFRFEGHSVSIFSNDFNLLYDIARDRLCYSQVQLISCVRCQEDLDLLDKDYIITRTPSEYCYKITVRDGIYRNMTDRQGLYNYLKNLDAEVKITKKYLEIIRGPNKYISGGYFYLKDPLLVDMVRLIMPDLIRSVHQIVVK